MNPPVPPESLRQLEQDGYFIVRGLIPPDQVRIIKQKIEEALSVPADQRQGNYDPELKARQGEALSERERFRKLGQFARNTREIVDQGIGSERVLAIVGHFLGDDVLLLYDSVFLKPAHSGGATPWHQDIGLWPDPVADAVNFWMAVDPATRANGCMQFVPGSHKGPIVPHVLYPDAVHKELPRDLVADVKTVHIELAPGDAVFWHSSLWHYSGPNTSDQSRIALAGVFIHPDAGRAATKCQGTMVWLVRDGRRCDWPLQKFVPSETSTTAGY